MSTSIRIRWRSINYHLSLPIQCIFSCWMLYTYAVVMLQSLVCKRRMVRFPTKATINGPSSSRVHHYQQFQVCVVYLLLLNLFFASLKPLRYIESLSKVISFVPSGTSYIVCMHDPLSPQCNLVWLSHCVKSTLDSVCSDYKMKE